MGYLLLRRGEASFARRGPLGVMIFFAGAVREKLRTWSWRESLEAAPNCLMPEEYMVVVVVEGRLEKLQVAPTATRQQRLRVYGEGREASMAGAGVKFDDA